LNTRPFPFPSGALLAAHLALAVAGCAGFPRPFPGDDGGAPSAAEAGTGHEDLDAGPAPDATHTPDGAPTLDAALPSGDAGLLDGGPGSPDATPHAPDAAPPVLDAGAAVPDAGAPVPDAAFPPWDAGPGCLGLYPPHAGPPDRYSGIQHLRDSALASALRDRVKVGHDGVSYDRAKELMFGTNGIDVHGGQVECVYTGERFQPRELDRTGGFNVEHSWPQSEFGGESATAKGDMHHLFPTERDINSCRSNYPYGWTESPSGPPCSRGGSERGPSVEGGETVFEVRPVKRGDMARAHFYFSVRYNLRIPADEEAVLRCWHGEDPPDDEERTRNTAIESLQGNRNPFIDRPEFLGAIANL
jgi:hypothetical protein